MVDSWSKVLNRVKDDKHPVLRGKDCSYLEPAKFILLDQRKKKGLAIFLCVSKNNEAFF